MRAVALAGLCLVVALACRQKPAPEHDEHAHEHPPGHDAHGHAEKDAHDDAHKDGHEALPRKVTVEKDVIAAAKIEVAAVRREALAETLNLPGEIAADPDHLARISSPAEGRVEAVRFREGQNVKKGDVLLSVRVPEIARVRAGHLAADAKAKAARANAERLRGLLAQRLAPEQGVIDAEAEASALELEASSLADQLGALGAARSGAFTITLRAPISGTVVTRDVVVGQPTSSQQVLGTLADLQEVWFLARVFEKDLGRLQRDAIAEVHLNAYPQDHFSGVVEYIGQQIDPVARTVTARIRLKNPEGRLRLGLFGTSQVSLGGAGQAASKLVVASTSVTELGGKPVVFVRSREGEFEVHEVTLGSEAIGRVEVLEGLREGEEVVTNGAFTLKSLLLKASFSGHAH